MEQEKQKTVEAQKFFDFYVDLIENERDTAAYYFSENAVLDWFGQTIKGEKNLRSFFRTTIDNVSHYFDHVLPVKFIGYRKSHFIHLPVSSTNVVKIEGVVKENTTINFPFEENEKTPPNKVKKQEMGQGDGFHVTTDEDDECKTPLERENFLEVGQGEEVVVNCMSSTGYVEFHRKISKKLQSETKWQRPCKLEIAYSIDPFQKYNIHLVIYEGNMKCKKNLLKDFDACQSNSLDT